MHDPDSDSDVDADRPQETSERYARVGWWLFVTALAATAAFVAWQVVGLLVLGAFGYYAMRPVRDRVETVVGSRRLAAGATVSAVLVPVVLLVVSLAAYVARQFQSVTNPLTRTGVFDLGRIDVVDSLTVAERRQVETLLSNPAAALGGVDGPLLSNVDVLVQVLGAVADLLVLVVLATTLSYVLLARDRALTAVFVDLAGGRDTTAYAYAAAVDEDLESVFFGNVLFASVVAVLAVLAYWVTNLVAPAGLTVPMVFVLGLLTGVASLVPVVVSKLVYVPVLASLGVQALRSGGVELAFVGVVGVAYLVVLDVVPQAFVQPYLSGRRLDTTLLLFSYLVGPAVFGWYGLFFLPVLVVLLFEAVRIVLPELLRGDRPGPEATVDTDTGTDPTRERADVPAGEETPDDDADDEDDDG